MHRTHLLRLAVLVAWCGIHAFVTAQAQTPPGATTLPTVRPARLTNVSIRATAGTGDSALVAGAVVQGSGSVPLLVRAIGPGLARFGISNFVRSPQLEVYRGSVLTVQTNTTAPGAVAKSALVGAFPLLEGPAGTADDAVVIDESTAGMITAHCTPGGGTPGVALVEFYDASDAATDPATRVTNFSARGRVESGDGLIVAGFTVAGPGEITLLLRAAGPTLQQFGLSGLLQDPTMELYAGRTLVAANDNWRSSDALRLAVQAAESAVGAFALTSANDAALVVTLPAGSYTLQVRGNGGGTGVALAEIYEIAAAASFDAARSTNAVGLDVYRQLAAARAGQNLAISPYSIESALALAYAGADGETRRQMAGVLRLPDDTGAVASGFATLRSALDAVAEQSKRLADARTAAGRPTSAIEWSAANRLFGQQGYAFRETFLTQMREQFAAPLDLLDFKFATERSRLAINAWVEQQTRQRIRELIPSRGVTEDTRLVLVNALYLNAPWESPFVAGRTVPRAFTLADGNRLQVPTMEQTGEFGHTVENGNTIVTLDYLGGGLQFVAVLPATGASVDALAAGLTSADLARWAKLGETNRKWVALSLPKFKIEGPTVPLTSTLQALGMTSAFDIPRGSANFDRIAPRRPDEYLAISDVFHQTFVDVNEAGTEAAAATAVVIGIVTSVPPSPLEVRLDRPFLFAIQHRASGACLFLGRVMDPR